MFREPRPAAIADLLDRLLGSGRHLVCLAGSPEAMMPPQGMATVLRKGNRSDIAIAGGLTLIPNSAAYTFPQFRAVTSGKKVGTRSEFYATVPPATGSDAEIESFYPAPGDHIIPGATHREGGRVFQHYWRITRKVSDLIREGEQEHLNDARRAFDLTIGAIVAAIGTLAGRSFGPAASPQAAEALAEEAFRKALPPALGTHPRDWIEVLDRLLQQTKRRDEQGWHSLTYNPPTRQGNRVFREVTTTPKTRIAAVPSREVVNY